MYCAKCAVALCASQQSQLCRLVLIVSNLSSMKVKYHFNLNVEVLTLHVPIRKGVEYTLRFHPAAMCRTFCSVSLLTEMQAWLTGAMLAGIPAW